MRDIVINTGPIIALSAATESLEWLPSLYGRIIIPYEVSQEIEAGGPNNAESVALKAIQDRIRIGRESSKLPLALLRELDPGEASVIYHAALNEIDTVAIDEKTGRRVARIHGLNVTGSLGILLKARREGLITCLRDCINRMSQHGIWISADLIAASLRQANES